MASGSIAKALFVNEDTEDRIWDVLDIVFCVVWPVLMAAVLVLLVFWISA